MHTHDTCMHGTWMHAVAMHNAACTSTAMSHVSFSRTQAGTQTHARIRSRTNTQTKSSTNCTFLCYAHALRLPPPPPLSPPLSLSPPSRTPPPPLSFSLYLTRDLKYSLFLSLSSPTTIVRYSATDTTPAIALAPRCMRKAWSPPFAISQHDTAGSRHSSLPSNP